MASDPNVSVVSGFLDYLKIEKGLAPLTVAAYTTDVWTSLPDFSRNTNARC